MSSLAYNLTRKLEWMGRRLRYIDDAEKINDWAMAMKTLNSVLKDLDIKDCSDGWKPWTKIHAKVDQKLRMTKTRSETHESQTAQKPGYRLMIKGSIFKGGHLKTKKVYKSAEQL